MAEIKRWYDESPKLEEMMRVLESMSDKELAQIAKYLYQVVNLYKKHRQTYNNDLSIGRDKLFGYYKAYQKRRWYDKNPSLSSAVNTMSTLSIKEIEEIIDGFIQALQESGMYSVYYKKKLETEEN